MTDKAYLSVRDVAAELSISAKTVYALIASQQLAAIRLRSDRTPPPSGRPSGKLLIRRVDLDAFVAARLQPAREPPPPTPTRSPRRVLDLPGADRYLS